MTLLLRVQKSFLFYGTNKSIIGTKNLRQVQIVLNEEKSIKIQININNFNVINMKAFELNLFNF